MFFLAWGGVCHRKLSRADTKPSLERQGVPEADKGLWEGILGREKKTLNAACLEK